MIIGGVNDLTLSTLIRAGVAAAALFAMALPSHAEAFMQPKGEVILTIDGSVSAEAPAGAYLLDIDALMALPTVAFKTTTIWTEGELTFSGVPLKTLLDLAGASGTIVEAEALNGYMVEVPMADLGDEAPIVAYHIDGAPFSRRDKGPLWIVYPYDSDEKYKSEVTYAYSIWQLQKLTVK